MFVRRKVVNGTEYYQLVEGYRDEAGKVRHRNIASLGRSPTVVDAVRLAQRQRDKCQRNLKAIGVGLRPWRERYTQDVAAAEKRLAELKDVQRRATVSIDRKAERPAPQSRQTGKRLTQRNARTALGDNPIVRAANLLAILSPELLAEMMLLGRLSDAEIAEIFDTATKEGRLATPGEVLQRAIERSPRKGVAQQ